MTEVQQLATFVTTRRFGDLSPETVQALKIRLLDALGCAIGALEGEPIRQIREQLADFGGRPLVSLIGGGRTAPDRAAFYNSALVRYLDFNDSYLAKSETCHPSDNIGSILAASQYANRSGKDLLTALAIAYQVQCRLSDVAPVRSKGFDHTVHGSYSVAAGTAYALGLDANKTANAIAIAGTAYNALRVTRTGNLSNWKGLAFPSAGWTATHAAFLAMRGITGPEEVFEGNKGFKETIAGRFEIDWNREDLDAVTRTIVKKFNAEVHSQATLEGLQEMAVEHSLRAADIQAVNLNTFDVAYNIIGGGEEGGKKRVRTKEEADHSLPYMMAAVLLDGNVLPEQYAPERINRADIQELLQKVHIQPKQEYSDLFPSAEACDITVELRDGRKLYKEKRDYEGFRTRPASWKMIVGKFNLLASPFMGARLRETLVETVENLERYSVQDLCILLEQVDKPVKTFSL